MASAQNQRAELPDDRSNDELTKLGDHRTFLTAVTTRLKRSYAMSLAQDAAVGCGVVVCVIAAAVWLLGIAALPMVIAAAGATALAFAFVSWRSIRLRPEAAIVARLADQRCDGGDVFATALVAGDSPFRTAIEARADSVAIAHQPRDVVRARIIWWKAAIAVLGLIVGTWLFVTEGPGAHQRAIAAGKKAAVEKAAENVKRSAEKLKQQGADPQLAKQLDALAKSLDRTTDPLEAARLLEQSALAIQPEDPAQALARKAAVKGLERGLATKPIAPGETAADQLRNAAQSVEALPDTSDLQKRLSELSKSQQANPDAAKELQKAADALAKGDTKAAKDALQKAADAQEKAAEQAAADQERANQAGQLKSSASSLQSQAQQQQQSPSPSSPGQTLAPGQTIAPGPGQPPGQTAAPGPGPSGQSGAGSTRPVVTLAPGQTLPNVGSLKPGQTAPPGASTIYVQTTGSVPPGASTVPIGSPGSGPPGSGPVVPQPGAAPGAGQGANGSTQAGSGIGGKPAGRGANNSVGPPGGTIAGTTGEVYAPGVVTPGGSGDVVGVGAAPSPAGKSRVPVAEALPASKDKAAKALDSSDLDPSEQDVVKGYFDSLNAPPASSPSAPSAPASSPPVTAAKPSAKKAPAKGKK